MYNKETCLSLNGLNFKRKPIWQALDHGFECFDSPPHPPEPPLLDLYSRIHCLYQKEKELCTKVVDMLQDMM